MKKLLEITYCDVCGNRSNAKWWQALHGWNGVVAEYYAPIDLCSECISAFDRVSDKWKYERYDGNHLSDEQLAECIVDVKSKLENKL